MSANHRYANQNTWYKLLKSRLLNNVTFCPYIITLAFNDTYVQKFNKMFIVLDWSKCTATDRYIKINIERIRIMLYNL